MTTNKNIKQFSEKIAVRVTPEMMQAIKQRAERNHTNIAIEVRIMIIKDLEREEKAND